MLNSRENLSLIVLHEKQVERMIRSEGHSTHIELWAQSLKRPCFKSTPPNLDAQLCSILHRQTHTRKKEKKNSVGKTIWCNFFSAHPAFESILIQNNSSKKKESRVCDACNSSLKSTYIFQSLFRSLGSHPKIMAVNFMVYSFYMESEAHILMISVSFCNQVKCAQVIIFHKILYVYLWKMRRLRAEILSSDSYGTAYKKNHNTSSSSSGSQPPTIANYDKFNKDSLS